ncbi:1-aminocyclopropane-1-carboxylate oxidase [Linum perenne]
MEQVLKGMARSLNLPDDNSFVEEMGSEPRISATFNLFPTCSRPDRVLGVNNHTDASVLTFLVQDKQVEGLQLLLDDGEWVRVPTTPSDALVISIGDQGEVYIYICICNI